MKTREEINEDLNDVGTSLYTTLDPDYTHFFKKWQKKYDKYLDLDIDEVSMTPLSLSDDNYFQFVKGKNHYIKKYNISNKGDYPLATGSVKNDSIAYYVKPIKESDIISDVCVSFNKDGTSQVFYRDYNFLMDRHHIALIPNKEILAKYLYFSLILYFQDMEFGWGTNIADIETVSSHSIVIPRPYKNYTSYDIQKILVEFLEYNLDLVEKYREKLNNIEADIALMEDGLVPAIFDRDDDYIKRMFIKWNTDPVEPRDKVDMVDFTLEDIEFEKLQIDSFITAKGGSSKYNKKYYQDENNIGKYPLMTGSLNIVANIKPIDTKDIIDVGSISYNKDNDGGSKAFYHTTPYILGGHHYALLINDKKEIHLKYFYYSMTDFFNRNKFYQSKQPVANIGLIKKQSIIIPKPLTTKTKTYTSYEVQEAIVSFIDRFYRWKANVEKWIGILRSDLDAIENGYLYKTFKG